MHFEVYDYSKYPRLQWDVLLKYMFIISSNSSSDVTNMAASGYLTSVSYDRIFLSQKQTVVLFLASAGACCYSY